MNHILHIFKKDLRRYAWAWIPLVVFAVIEIYLYGTTSGIKESGLNGLLTVLTSTLGGILFFLVTVMVVQEENLADPDAYWLARPISRGTVLSEKILFILFLIAAYTLSQIVILILNGGSNRLYYSVLEILPSLAIWQAQIFLAAQTRSLPRYLLLTVGLTVAFYVSMFILVFFIDSIFSNWNLDIGQLPTDIPSHVATIIQTLYWLVVGLSILCFLYFKRRILMAWLLLIPACFIALVLTPQKSVYGLGRQYTFNNEINLTLDHLSTQGSIHTNGTEYTECIGVFSGEDDQFDQDVWVSVQAATINDGETDIEFDQYDRSQRLKSHGNGQKSLSLGYIKKGALKDLSGTFEVTCSLQIITSKQVETGRMPLKEGASYVGSGNRLVVQSIYRNDDKLEVNFAGFAPSFTFEAKGIDTGYEALNGRFSFALNRLSDGQRKDFNLSKSWAKLGTLQKADAETPLEDTAQLDDYEIIVFSRLINGQTWDHIRAESVNFE